MKQNNQPAVETDNGQEDYEQNDFLIEQYKTLREEVKETKARIFQLAMLGIIGLPSSYFLAENYENLKILRASLPIIICTFLLIFLSETRALMRCGQFIKENIEPCFKCKKCNTSQRHWEGWLESGKNICGIKEKRLVDVFLAISFYVLFLIYYCLSVVLAYNAHNKDQWGFPIAIFYSIIGGAILIFLGWSFKSSTSTAKQEHEQNDKP
ncbi:hypothetical protein [Candidatus Electronema sp. TJ]|uniref:hypothetical protein n=1 Tax=Candidatus Electronema sp. TJ TaxID=3401573 RepID=UPI003AA9084B